MKRVVTIFGTISGLILIINLLVMVDRCYNNPDFKSNDVLGYTGLVVIFSLIFFGIKNYRDKQLGGFIPLGRAFRTGALIALFASTLYVVFWLFYYYLFVPDFLDHYIPHAIREATRKGATARELADTTREMDNFRNMYANPLFVVLITYFEVLPIGLVVAFISSLILKRKEAQMAR